MYTSNVIGGTCWKSSIILSQYFSTLQGFISTHWKGGKLSQQQMLKYPFVPVLILTEILCPFLQQMDEIFGGSGVGSAPPGTIISTPLFPSQNPSPLLPSQTPSEVSFIHPSDNEDHQPGPSTVNPTNRTEKGHQTIIPWYISVPCWEETAAWGQKWQDGDA